MLSIIIPVYNEEEKISDCLKSILEQDYTGDFEVVAVNDGSTDRSREILEELSEKYDDLRVINLEKNRGYAFALNEGLKNAKGEVVVSIDADCILKEGSLERVRETFSDDEVGAFFGEVKVGNEGIHPTYARVAKLEDEKYRYGGAFMGFRKKLLAQSGGFSTTGGGWSGTDDEIKARAQKQKWGVVYDDQAAVYSDFPTGIKHVMKNKYNSGITYIRTKIRHPEDFDLKVPLSVGYVFALIIFGIGSIFWFKSLLIFLALILGGIAMRTKKAYKVAKVSGKSHYFLLYYLYGFASDIVRAFGLLTEAKNMLKLTFKQLKSTLRRG